MLLAPCSPKPVFPSQDIECLASDGMLLVSCCLVGQIRVWDAQTGDCLTVIPKLGYVATAALPFSFHGPEAAVAVQSHLSLLGPIPARREGHTNLQLLHFRLRRDSSGIFDYQEGWDQSPDAKCGPEESYDNGHQLKRMLSPPQPPLFCDQPDLTSLIDTNFCEQARAASETRHRTVCAHQKEAGYDFGSLVGKAYEEHSALNCMNFTGFSTPHGQVGLCTGASGSRSPSCGSGESGCSARRRSLGDEVLPGFDKSSPVPTWSGDFESSVWSLDLQGNLIVAGRSNGKLEVSEGAGVLSLEGGTRCCEQHASS